MRFFVDHDVPAEVSRVLRQEGHEVVELRQLLPVQANDFDVLSYAREHELFLISCNRDDFLALTANHPNPGIIFLVRRRTRQARMRTFACAPCPGRCIGITQQHQLCLISCSPVG